MAAAATDRSPDRDQLSQTEAVDVWNTGQVQYKVTVAFTEQFVDLSIQSDFKEAQSARQVHDDDTGNDS